jgi:hypothetical protein
MIKSGIFLTLMLSQGNNGPLFILLLYVLILFLLLIYHSASKKEARHAWQGDKSFGVGDAWHGVVPWSMTCSTPPLLISKNDFYVIITLDNFFHVILTLNLGCIDCELNDDPMYLQLIIMRTHFWLSRG